MFIECSLNAWLWAKVLHVMPREFLITTLYGSIATPISQIRKLRLREIVYVWPKLILSASGIAGDVIPGQSGSNAQALNSYYPMQRLRGLQSALFLPS